MKALKKIANHFEEALVMILLSGMTIVISLQIILRQLGLPLAWTEETARYMFVWLIYMGCSLGVKYRRHIKVDAVLLLFKERGRFILSIISNILFMAFTIIITYHGTLLLYKIQFVQGQVSPAMRISMALPYSSFVFGSIFMLIRLMIDTKCRIKEHKTGHVKEVV